MRKGLIAALSMLACSLPLACAGPDAGISPLAASAPTSYRLGPGDQLRITIVGMDALNNSYLVDDSGSIAVPMLDPILVAGKTVRETEAQIAGMLLARQLVLDPKVSAQIQSYRPFFITGEVQKPGQYPYMPGMSLMTAVSVAGGYTFRANTHNATITRASVKGVATPDTPVLPGDQILVRESWF